MGRPLRTDLLSKLRLTATIKGGESVILGKQVGYNKYLTGEENPAIVRLVDKASASLEDGEGLLVLTDGANTYNVTKITKRLMLVAKESDACYAYEYDEATKAIVFAKSGVSVATTPLTYTLTINPTPADATVVLTAEGFEQEENSITVNDGTTVDYTVSKEGYASVTGEKVVTKNETLDVTLLDE